MTNKNLGNLGKKGSIISAYICHKHVIPGREGIWRAHERVLLLGLLALLSYISQDHVPWLAWCTMAWALPFQSLIKKMLPRLSCSWSFRSIFFIEVLSSQMMLPYTKLTEHKPEIPGKNISYLVITILLYHFLKYVLTSSIEHWTLLMGKLMWFMDTSSYFSQLNPNDISKGPTDIIREIETINM